MRPIAKYSYLLMCAAAVVLAATGIGVFITGKAPMTRWGLMLHVAVAPAFALGILIVALTWPSAMRRNAASGIFWLFLLSGMTAMLTGVVPMLPLFGADGQHFLYLTHRWAGIVSAAALVLFTALLFSRSEAKAH